MRHVGLSVVAHLLVLGALALAPVAPPPLTIPITIEVTIELPPPDAPAPRLSLVEPSGTVTTPRELRPRARRETAVAPSETSTLTVVTGEVVTLGPPDPAEPSEVPRDEDRIRRALDVGRIAREMVLDEDPGPSTRGEPAGGGDRTGGLADAVPLLFEAEAEARHGEHLRELAMLREWLSHTAIEPRERPDGSWVWEGTLFTATIAPDGAVSYADRDPASIDWSTGTVGFDITDLFMGAAGLDPFASERERFMEETEELRLRLEGAHLDDEIARSVRLVRGSLRAIWDDVDRPAVARRRDVFRTWDENDDGPIGRARREAVVGFVREEIPFGSEDAYSEAELGALNALRESDEAFDPY